MLDFVNNPEDIGAAFAPYYDQTQLEAQYESDRLFFEQIQEVGNSAAIYRIFQIVGDFTRLRRWTRSDVALSLGFEIASQASQQRDGLLGKGLIYAPERGQLSFTVPQMGQYLRDLTDRP